MRLPVWRTVRAELNGSGRHVFGKSRYRLEGYAEAAAQVMAAIRQSVGLRLPLAGRHSDQAAALAHLHQARSAIDRSISVLEEEQAKPGQGVDGRAT